MIREINLFQSDDPNQTRNHDSPRMCCMKHGSRFKHGGKIIGIVHLPPPLRPNQMEFRNLIGMNGSGNFWVLSKILFVPGCAG